MRRVRYTSARIEWSGGEWIMSLTLDPDTIAAARAATDEVNHDGKMYAAELKPYHKPRSLDANAYFHALVGDIAEKMNLGNDEVKARLVVEYGSPARYEDGTPMGFKLPKEADATKIYPYVQWFDTRSEGGKEFDCYKVYKQTHEMDTKEMSRLIDGAMSEAKTLGIETKTPAEIALLEGEWKRKV